MSYQVLARKWRPAALRRRRRAAGRHAHAAQRDRERPHRAGLRVRRLARLRQDHHRPHPGARAQLREGAHGRPVRRVRRLRGDCAGARHGRARDRRGQPHRHRQHPRGGDCRAGDRAGARPLQGVHHRRGAPALDALVQRPAEVDRGAAAARGLHDGHDRAAQDPRHHPVALAGLRVQDHPHQGDRRAAAHDRRRRADRRCPTTRSG